jgi:hypothetical protein
MTSETRLAAPARLGTAVPAVVLAMALAAVGNGLLFAFIPVRLREGGFDPAWAGAMLTAMAAAASRAACSRGASCAGSGTRAPSPAWRF